jgi:probable rRNA maturation factor
MSCLVNYKNHQKEVPFILKPKSLQKTVETVLSFENETADFLSVEFLSDTKMRQLHEQYFSDPSSTDCMSFPLNDTVSPRHLGDILICPKTALLQVAVDHSLFFDELTLYLIHGLLHLLGYDDIDPKDRKIMRTKESKYMRELRKNRQILSGKLLL